MPDFEHRIIDEPSASEPPRTAERSSTPDAAQQRPLSQIILQAKLAVGPADDPYEREADQVADRVVRMLRRSASESPMPNPGAGSRVQRMQPSSQPRITSVRAASRAQRASSVGLDGGVVDNDTERRIQSARGSGSRLPDQVRGPMEQAFGTDFSSIRINVGSASTDLNDRIQAKAFTVGNDIFFRGSAPDTTTVQGQHLLAHELTHTIQQRGSDGGRATRSTIQRKVGVTTTLGPRNIKGAKVSTGGSLGVVLIPSIAAKFETDPAAAIDTATAYNSLLGGGNGKAWSATSPTARAATQQEAQDIADSLERADQRKPGSAGDPTRVATMVSQFRTHPNNVVIYEQATGKDFIKYLAQGAEKTDAAVKQSEKGRAKKGSGLAQLADPGYADQLGRIAAIDIFMGHKDRLHGTGNMENWMSDVKKKKISLVDNEMSDDSLALWSANNDVIDLAAQNISAVSGRISDEIDSLLQHTGYGGGKLGAKDLAVWSNTIKPVFDTNLEKGLTAGRLLLMQRGWSLANSLGTSSPLYVRLYERLDYFHLNG